MDTANSVEALPDVLGPEVLGAYLDMPVKTLAQWRYMKIGPPFMKIGRHVRYRRVDVVRWLDSQYDRPAS